LLTLTAAVDIAIIPAATRRKVGWDATVHVAHLRQGRKTAFFHFFNLQ